MKVSTPEISWHGKEAIFSIDVQRKQHKQPQRIATASLDNNIRVWKVKSNGDVEFLSNLSRHDKAVNVVRFSNDGSLLASAGDDSTIIIWKLSDKNEAPNLLDDDIQNKETWNSIKSLRGHLEDVNDLCWSSNNENIVSGSVDHTTILWDCVKGVKLAVFHDAKHFITGVTWDPLNKYVVSMSCDRSMRVYNLKTKKMTCAVNKMVQVAPASKPPANGKTKDNETRAPPGETDNDKLNIDDDDIEIIDDKSKSSDSDKPERLQRMFHDETVVRRRLQFTSDGKLLIVPAGCISNQINAVFLFSRRNLSKPVAYLPIPKEAPCLVAVCPVTFRKRETRRNGERAYFDMEVRHVYAVATVTSILVYDTQHQEPFGYVSNIHYESITDIRWSPDGRFLVASSRDGFCSLIHFDGDEIGEIMPLEVSSDVVMAEPTLPETMTSQSEEITAAQSNTKENDENGCDDVMMIEDDDVMEVNDIVPRKTKEEEICAKTEVVKDVPVAQKHENNEKKKEPRRIVLTSLQPVPVPDTPAVAPTSGESKAAGMPSSGGKRRVQLISVVKQ